jgi:hypothetical protein
MYNVYSTYKDLAIAICTLPQVLQVVYFFLVIVRSFNKFSTLSIKYLSSYGNILEKYYLIC